MEQFHTVYLITCMVNNKSYIGVHSTKNLDDGYMGSSRFLDNDIKKYGKTQFTKTIIEIHSTRQQAFEHEKRLVNEEWVNRSDTYNKHLGGSGYPLGQFFSVEHRRKLSEATSRNRKGTKLSSKTKAKISAANTGNKRDDLADYNIRHKTGKSVKWTPEALEKKRQALLAWYQSPAGIARREQSRQRMTENNPNKS